ncbi:alginate export family protein [Acinetobacter bereziniae]|uniref:alginate export family protein n=2 Tax=Moraxellaceae TaxID=468 RepID=UPI003008A858
MEKSSYFHSMLCVVVLSFVPLAAVADYEIKSGNLTGELGLTITAANLYADHINFGSGRIDLRDQTMTGQQATWQEAYLKPNLNLNYKLDSDINLILGTSIVASQTFGDGDAGGYTRRSDGRTSVEELYAGIGYGDWKLTAGRQNYSIATGFIIMDGNLDQYQDGTYYIAPRSAFRNSTVLAWEQQNLKAQLFTLGTDYDLGSFKMNGANLDYDWNENLTLGLTAFKVKAPSSDAAPKDGMQVYNLRALNAKSALIPALTLNGEYAIQRGRGDGVSYQANAWYTQADYVFDGLPFQPTLGYRYSFFSGDDNFQDKQRRSWNALSKGYIGWGTWLLGDVAGNYALYNSNEKVQQFSIKSQLNDQLTFGTIYYQLALDKANYFGTPVRNRRFADEYSIYLEWVPTTKLYTSLSYSWLNPKSAAKEAFGDHKNFSAFGIYLKYRL